MRVAIRYKNLVCDEPGEFNIENLYLESFRYDEQEERYITDVCGEDPEDAFIFNLTDDKHAKIVKELVQDFQIPTAMPTEYEVQVIGVELVLADHEMILDEEEYDFEEDGQPLIEPTPLRLVKQENPE